MTCENMLDMSPKIINQNVIRSITLLGQSLFQDGWQFVSGSLSSSVTNEQSGEWDVKIGQDWMKHNCNINEINQIGYIITIQHMYHEHRHIQQNIKEWNDSAYMNSIKSVNRMTDIIRRNFIKSFYPSAYTHNYVKDPSELDTEVYGLKKTIDYFRSDALVTQDVAKETLFQLMMSDDYGYKETMCRYGVTSADDMLEAFMRIRDRTVYERYPVTLEKSPLDEIAGPFPNDMTEEFLTSGRYRTHREELKKYTTGKQQDKLLEQTVVMKYPDIGDLVPRLRTELNNCREQMQSRILVPRHHAVPVSRINYDMVARQLEDGFAEAVGMMDENGGPTL